MTLVRDPDTGTPQRSADVGGGIRDFAVDPRTGTLDLVFEDNQFSGGVHNDIALTKSTDGDRTWSTRIKVNRSPAGVTAFTRMVDVLPDGTVAVTTTTGEQHAGRRHPPDRLLCRPLARRRGQLGCRGRIAPTSIDDATAPFALGRFLGDYEGLTNDGTAVKPSSCRPTAATPATERTSSSPP